jgi:hypothetical protein
MVTCMNTVPLAALSVKYLSTPLRSPRRIRRRRVPKGLDLFSLTPHGPRKAVHGVIHRHLEVAVHRLYQQALTAHQLRVDAAALVQTTAGTIHVAEAKTYPLHHPGVASKRKGQATLAVVGESVRCVSQLDLHSASFSGLLVADFKNIDIAKSKTIRMFQYKS